MLLTECDEAQIRQSENVGRVRCACTVQCCAGVQQWSGCGVTEQQWRVPDLEAGAASRYDKNGSTYQSYYSIMWQQCHCAEVLTILMYRVPIILQRHVAAEATVQKLFLCRYDSLRWEECNATSRIGSLSCAGCNSAGNEKLCLGAIAWGVRSCAWVQQRGPSSVKPVPLELVVAFPLRSIASCLFYQAH